eukprot:1127752_1
MSLEIAQCDGREYSRRDLRHSSPGDQKLTIHFTRLATDGGHPIDRYTLETTDGKHVSTPITGSAFELIGLTNGQLYEYHLKAHNAMGESTAAVISGTPVPNQPQMRISN